jgi:hypothetical protein
MTTIRYLITAACLSFPLVAAAAPADPVARSFQHPPASARPWVYWFPVNGNLTKAGLTGDLEAMQRAGIGGLLSMPEDQSAPVGQGTSNAYDCCLFRQVPHYSTLADMTNR